MLPIIQSLWVGDPLSNLEKLCIQSFLDNGHEFHLYVYDEVQGIPGGAVVKDGNDILPYNELTAGPLQEWSSLSDYFRYALLYKKGGWWVDMDTVCIKPFDFGEEIIFPDKSMGSGWIPNTPLRFPAGHPFMKTMQDLCRERIQIENVGRVMMGGPPLLTEQIAQAGLQRHAQSQMRFFLPHEYEFSNFDDTYRDGLLFPANTHAVHIGNSVSRKRGIDKNAQFDAGSLFEQLKDRHGIRPVAGAMRVTSDDIHALQQVRLQRVSNAKRRRKSRDRMLQITVLILAAALVASVLY